MQVRFLVIYGLLQLVFFCSASGNQPPERVKNFCEYLGGRSDKNFLGSGNVALVLEPAKTRVLFVQQWKEKGLFDWAAGSVRKWYPDRIEMKEPAPPLGTSLSHTPVLRRIFISRDDVVGMELVWRNDSAKDISVRASFSGMLPGTLAKGGSSEAHLLSSVAPYSEKVPQPVHFAIGWSVKPADVELNSNEYTVSFAFRVGRGEQKSITILLATGTDKAVVEKSLLQWKRFSNISEAVRDDWNKWFAGSIPAFTCSDPYFEKLYYYRWWSLYTKLIFARVGHFYFPAPREGTVGYDGVVSYSGAYISVDELRWMRNPDWAFSTTKEFFAPGNLNDGYLSNHI